MLVMPDRHWRIITSARHSTVWDGGDLIFDFNYQAFGVDPTECFESTFDKELAPEEYRQVYWPGSFAVDQRRQTVHQTSANAGPLEKPPSVRPPPMDTQLGLSKTFSETPETTIGA